MTKEERHELIERYLSGKLEGLERKAFEDNLANDAILQKELEIHRGLQQAVGDKKIQHFAALIKEREAVYFEKMKQQKPHLLQRYSKRIAGVAAILIFACLAYWYLIPQPTTQELFADYFEPYQSPGTFRSEDIATVDNDFILALARYDEEQYAEAIDFFTKNLSKNPDKDIAIFLRGVSYLSIDNLNLAEADLKKVADNTNSLFQDRARWYLALTYLKQGQVEEARGLLETLPASEEVDLILKNLE